MDELSAAQDLAMDRPTAQELLEIIAETLSDHVVPATASHAQHQARVAANLCRVLSRELGANTPTKVGVEDTTDLQSYTAVLELVRSKLAINKPGYDAHGADQEQGIIA